MKFINIEYNKEYVELIQAFIPDYKEKNLILGKAGPDLVLIDDEKKESTPVDYKVFTTQKSTIKHHLYKVLRKYSKKDLPWGMLVGVNPLKLFESLQNSYGIEKSKSLLKEKYHLSQEKIDLGFEVLKNQEPIKEKYKNHYSIYIDIPFCLSKCSYCSYPTYIGQDEQVIDSYLNALKKEIIGVSAHLDYNIASIYIGGGTPSAIGKDRLEDLLGFLLSFVNTPDEFTVELGRPDSFDEDLVTNLKNYGVNRICINPQSLNDQTLSNIGRRHKAKDIAEAYKQARSAGDYTINMDLIMGLDDINSFDQSLESVVRLQPDEITIHGLAYKKGADLKNQYVAQDSNYEEIRDQIIQNTTYRPYYLYRQKNIYNNSENIGYTRGQGSIYNVCMMSDVHSVIAMGLGGSSKIFNDKNLTRHMNNRDLNAYIDKVDQDIEAKIELLKKGY